MASEVVTVAPDATLGDAATLMHERRLDRLPVVEHGRLVGVVTRIDVLDALHGEGASAAR